MNSDKMAELVIEQLTKLGCHPLAKVMSISKGQTEKAYLLLVGNPTITLDEFLKEMDLEKE